MTKIRAAVGVGHVSRGERWLTVPRLGRFRLADGHVSRGETCLTERRKVECGALDVALWVQRVDC